jgi:ABC-type iron transport system FetAB permease component
MATEELGSAHSLAGLGIGAAPAASDPLPAPAQRALRFGLLLSAVRCTIQYVLLPFVLPWIGVTGAIPPWLTLALGALAIAALVRNVRTLWRLRHGQRWSYLFLAVVIGGALLIFAFVDLHTLLGL